MSKIEKVPRGIQGAKSSKDMASSRNLISTIGAQASPKKGGRNQVSRRVTVPCWLATLVANALRIIQYFDGLRITDEGLIRMVHITISIRYFKMLCAILQNFLWGILTT